MTLLKKVTCPLLRPSPSLPNTLYLPGSLQVSCERTELLFLFVTSSFSQLVQNTFESVDFGKSKKQRECHVAGEAF